MKKILVFVVLLATFSGCISISKFSPVEYEIEELPTLITEAYNKVYGINDKRRKSDRRLLFKRK